MARRAEPVRTCVGCRRRAASADLLRVVAVEDVLVPDPRRRSPGRGAHLHPDQGCLDLAERRSAFRRAFRSARALDATGVREFLAETKRQQGEQVTRGTHVPRDTHREQGETTMSPR